MSNLKRNSVNSSVFEDLFLVPLRNGVSYSSDQRGAGVPMVNMGEAFRFDRISDQECERVPLTVGERERFLLEEGDLLFVRQSLKFEGAGKCVYVGPSEEPRTWESHLIRVRLDSGKADSRYYYYYFRSPGGRKSIEAIIEQVAAAGIRGSDLRTLDVPYPPRKEQQGVADALSALDDKIAVNDRIVKTALDLADSLYSASSEGLVLGSETFGSVAAVYGGGTPSTAEPTYWDGGIAWTTPSDVTALSAPYLFKTSRTITELGLANCASRIYPAGSIFMTSRATIGAFAVPQIPAAVNQGFIVVVPPGQELRWWLFHEMRSRVDEMLELANGSTFLELSRKNFKSMPVLVVTPDLLKRFDAQVAPIHERAAQASRESTALAQLRDTLLPKLMSGEIRVRDAEHVVGEVT